MLYPKFLSKDDIIGITAPSDGKTDNLDLIRLDNAYHKLNEFSFKVLETKNVRTSNLGRSDTAINRAKYIEELFLNKDVKVIISASGGEFMLEVLPYLDLDIIKQNPKWFCGYSDNTILSFIITTNLDIASMYSDNISCFGMKKYHQSINNYLSMLKGNIIEQHNFKFYQRKYQQYKTGLESYNLDTLVRWKNLNNEDTIELNGRLLVGCLDILLCLVGTKYDMVNKFIENYKEDGIIWALESCELTYEQITRGLWQLREAGWFKYTKGFIFGRLVINNTNINDTYENSIKNSLDILKVPIIIDADFGHTSPRMTLINGSYVEINSTINNYYIKTKLK